MGIWDKITGVGESLGQGVYDITAGQVVGGLKKLAKKRGSEWSEIDPTGRYGQALGRAGAFAGAGERGFRDTGQRMLGTEDMLRRRAMGEDSLVAEQLRQGLQQNIAGQMSMARGGSPRDRAMMARQAMGNAARMGAGMSGQAAQSRLAEMAQATNQLAGFQQGMRAQDLQAALGARGQQLQGYGALEGARTQRYMADMGVPTFGEQVMGAFSGAAKAGMMSDRDAKKDIQVGNREAAQLMRALTAASGAAAGGAVRNDAERARRAASYLQADTSAEDMLLRRDRMAQAYRDAQRQRMLAARDRMVAARQAERGRPMLEANTDLQDDYDYYARPPGPGGGKYESPDELLASLKAYKYKYKAPEKHGKGERLGIMAQDLEKTKAGKSLVKEGKDGSKRIDVGGLATANTAMLAELGRRLEELEKGK